MKKNITYVYCNFREQLSKSEAYLSDMKALRKAIDAEISDSEGKLEPIWILRLKVQAHELDDKIYFLTNDLYERKKHFEEVFAPEHRKQVARMKSELKFICNKAERIGSFHAVSLAKSLSETSESSDDLWQSQDHKEEYMLQLFKKLNVELDKKQKHG